VACETNKVKPFIDKKTAKKKAANIEREVDKVASILYDGTMNAALRGSGQSEREDQNNATDRIRESRYILTRESCL
jgi:hypothetical protein